MDRSARFALFIAEMEEAEPASTGEEARRLLETKLNDVEDRFSGAPFNPANWRSGDPAGIELDKPGSDGRRCAREAQ